MLIALAVAAAGFFVGFSVSHTIMAHPTSEIPAATITGWRVDFLDLALCATAITLVFRARHTYLARTGAARLPHDEHLLWLGTWILIGVKLFTAMGAVSLVNALLQ